MLTRIGRYLCGALLLAGIGTATARCAEISIELDSKALRNLSTKAKAELTKRVDEVGEIIRAVPPPARAAVLTNLPIGVGTLRTIKDFATPGRALQPGESQVVPLSARLETIQDIKRPHFLPAHFIEQAYLAQKAVGRIAYKADGENGNPLAGIGTGFLVAPSLVLTNNHVLRNKEDAKSFVIQMHYQQDGHGQILDVKMFDFDPDGFFYTSDEQNLDFTLIRLRSKRIFSPDAAHPKDVNAGELYGSIQLAADVYYSPNLQVNIIQHPQGRPKEVVLHNNYVTDIFEKVIRYTADTEGGSSGSPVFDNMWTLVGLHHAGGDEVDPKNEGVRMDRIVADIRAHVPANILHEIGL
jgi:V8-like Glu-specific endopeptidase